MNVLFFRRFEPRTYVAMMLKQPIFRVHRRDGAAGWPRLFLLLAVVSMLLSGCDAGRGLEAKAEVDEPHYRRGLQMVRSGQNQVALEAFLKVIEKRNGDAPESHLEAGQIYLQHIKDPIAAIYHFRKHLELRPNGPQAHGVRQLIETAKKEFARTLAGNPLEQQVDRLDLIDTIEKLRADNARLLAALEAAGRTVSAGPTVAQAHTPSQPSTPPRRQAPQQPLPEDLPVQPVVPVETTSGPAPSTRPAPTRPAGMTAASPTPPAPTAPAGRTYTVQAGDNLYKISVKAYGTGSRWPAILEANRDQLRSERDVKPGMMLRLP